MICKRNSDNIYFNYEFIGKDSDYVKVWNPDLNIIKEQEYLYEVWLKEFTIIDKWGKL